MTITKQQAYTRIVSICTTCLTQFESRKGRKLCWTCTNNKRPDQRCGTHGCKDCGEDFVVTSREGRVCNACRNTRKYGISFAVYKKLHEKQAGRCAICGEPRPLRGRSGLHIDHNHQTGQVRGLLCPHCNQLVGVFENQGMADAIRAYLSVSA